MFLTAGFDIAKREEAMTLGARAWIFKGTPDIDNTLKEIIQNYEAVGGAKTIATEKKKV
jgi:hypothetical protein